MNLILFSRLNQNQQPDLFFFLQLQCLCVSPASCWHHTDPHLKYNPMNDDTLKLMTNLLAGLHHPLVAQTLSTLLLIITSIHAQFDVAFLSFTSCCKTKVLHRRSVMHVNTTSHSPQRCGAVRASVLWKPSFTVFLSPVHVASPPSHPPQPSQIIKYINKRDGQLQDKGDSANDHLKDVFVLERNSRIKLQKVSYYRNIRKQSTKCLISYGI